MSAYQLEQGRTEMHQLPETGFLRLSQIIGNSKSQPPMPPIIPVKKTCWWAGVKTGRFPKPVKLGPRVTAWRVEDRCYTAKYSAHIRSPK